MCSEVFQNDLHKAVMEQVYDSDVVGLIYEHATT